MYSILVVRLWYALSLFTILFANPILLQRQDENAIPWPRGGFNVPIGSAKQSWYIFYNGTGCELPECTAATQLNNIWLSMINQMIDYLKLGTLPIREPLSVHLPMPVNWRGHERGFMLGVIEPRRKNGVERDELLVAMLNLRQQVLEHVVFRRFLADIYQGWRDLSATVSFGARLKNPASGDGIDMVTWWDADAMNGNATSLNALPVMNPTYHQPSMNDTNAVQIAKRAPASNVSEDLPPWPVGRFRKPIGTSKGSWFNTYEATSMETGDPEKRALWTNLCDLIIQDMLDSPVDLVKRSYVHETDSASSSQEDGVDCLTVLFSPEDKGIEKGQVIAAMESIKRLIAQYCCLAFLEVWMYEGQHDKRGYGCFYKSFPIGNGPNSSSTTNLPLNLVDRLQNVGSDPDTNPVPAVDVT